MTGTALSLGTGIALAAAPPGIGPYANVFWNVDALVKDKFGNGQVCVRNFNVLNVGKGFCQIYYQPLFPTARHSAFRLVSLASNPLGGANGPNVEPVRFYGSSGPYVSCGHGEWLAITNARSQLWPIACVAK